jgi:hypothetical protein
MFDIGSAVVLGLVGTGLVTLAISLIYGPKDKRISALACLVIAVITVILVAESDFATKEVVLDHSLGSLNFASQMVVALLLAGIMSGIWEALRAVKNIGQNAGT